MSESDLLIDCIKDAAKERDELAAALGLATADRDRQKKSREHWINRAEKLEILARRLWIRINGDDEFFESSVKGQLPAGDSGS